MSCSGKPVEYRALSVADYPRMCELWLSDGVEVDPRYDTKDSVLSFLSRNRGYCFAAVSEDVVIGFIMVGCDGRSARVYHLVVDSDWRREGIAHELTIRSWSVLREEGIVGVDVIVFRQDPSNEFWESEGFRDRDELMFRALDDDDF